MYNNQYYHQSSLSQACPDPLLLTFVNATTYKQAEAWYTLNFKNKQTGQTTTRDFYTNHFKHVKPQLFKLYGNLYLSKITIRAKRSPGLGDLRWQEVGSVEKDITQAASGFEIILHKDEIEIIPTQSTSIDI